MRELPIIFTAESVRAVLDGRKSQTRRVITRADKEAPLDYYDGMFWFADGDAHEIKPRYQVGDRLYVKEAARLAFVDGNCFGLRYEASDGEIRFDRESCEPFKLLKNTNPRFMPRWASRITLEVTEVRVQRVQEISEEDAIAEGLIAQVGDGIGYGPGWKFDGVGYYGSIRGQVHAPRHGKCSCKLGLKSTAVCAYADIWDSINAKRGYPWKDNPWVFAYTFKRVD